MAASHNICFNNVIYHTIIHKEIVNFGCILNGSVRVEFQLEEEVLDTSEPLFGSVRVVRFPGLFKQ